MAGESKITCKIDNIDDAEKEFLGNIKQQNDDNYKRIQQHFEERWQETTNNKIQLNGSPSEVVSFVKSVFLYGCNVGWNDCYTFHEDLIQKGLNKQ